MHPRVHLPIDHVTQGHADLHPDPLDVVEIEMMKDSEGERQHGDACSVHVGVVDPSRAGGVVTLEEPDDLSKQHRLNDLDDFLIRKTKAVTELSDASKQHFTEKSYRSSVPLQTCMLRSGSTVSRNIEPELWRVQVSADLSLPAAALCPSTCEEVTMSWRTLQMLQIVVLRHGWHSVQAKGASNTAISSCYRVCENQ